eukprot:CAMPEP_0184706872 /NCGR_PEP_ID=MMETSP0313-20130426/36981_1 /TAXON_ID=2792 /ORGANISM="Porphyridium aerugineum, Strain SAG 1380-2" /LENGTH=591 /DNA_ID=CAMNT_0027168439 /DNA_START=1440 /DNA_END=3215 /DNA_ORIENTATION=+
MSNPALKNSTTANTLESSNMDGSPELPDTRLDQAQLPILDALKTEANSVRAGFFCPGHRQGKGVPEPLREVAFSERNGLFAIDLPELPALDNLFGPAGPIKEAESLAADLLCPGGNKHFRTFFLVNGSTCGLVASLLAISASTLSKTMVPGADGPKDMVLLPRNVHQSVIHGLVLSGLTPFFVEPEYDANLDLIHGLTLNAVERALKDAGPHVSKRLAAVLVVSPTYYGVSSDLQGLSMLAKQHGALFIVDEAHGAHLSFNQQSNDNKEVEWGYPKSALACGADIAVQSTHKTLSACTQAAMLHVHRASRLVTVETVARTLQLVQSSSPSYLLLASLDAARWKMANNGNECLSKARRLAQRARESLQQIPGISVLSCPKPFSAMDDLRLTVLLDGLGMDGFEADDFLIDRGVYAELPSTNHIMFIITDGNTDHEIDLLVQVFQELSEVALGKSLETKLSKQDDEATHAPLPSSQSAVQIIMPHGTSAMRPRDAFFSNSAEILLGDSENRVCATTVCAYPPGIPMLLPGERITRECIEYIQQILEKGGTVTGLNCDEYDEVGTGEMNGEVVDTVAEKRAQMVNTARITVVDA